MESAESFCLYWAIWFSVLVGDAVEGLISFASTSIAAIRPALTAIGLMNKTFNPDFNPNFNIAALLTHFS
jgi:hypothetical protein